MPDEIFVRHSHLLWRIGRATGGAPSKPAEIPLPVVHNASRWAFHAVCTPRPQHNSAAGPRTPRLRAEMQKGRRWEQRSMAASCARWQEPVSARSSAQRERRRAQQHRSKQLTRKAAVRSFRVAGGLTRGRARSLICTAHAAKRVSACKRASCMTLCVGARRDEAQSAAAAERGPMCPSWRRGLGRRARADVAAPQTAAPLPPRCEPRRCVAGAAAPSRHRLAVRPSPGCDSRCHIPLHKPLRRAPPLAAPRIWRLGPDAARDRASAR